MLSFLTGLANNEKQESKIASISGILYQLKSTASLNDVIPLWKKRWFAIEGKSLRWYRSRTSADPSGSIDLHTVVGVKLAGKSSNTFIMITGKRKFILRATSCAEADKWMRCIILYVDLAKGGTGTAIMSTRLSHTKRKDERNTTLEKALASTLHALNQLEVTM